MRHLLMTVVLLCGVGAMPALAQVPVNPVGLAWEADDHAAAQSYELAYFMGTATSPVTTLPIAKSAVTGPGPTYQTALPRPFFGEMTAKLRIVARDAQNQVIYSEWSTATVPFVFTPKAPTGARPVP
jgi:hypothetical protein